MSEKDKRHVVTSLIAIYATANGETWHRCATLTSYLLAKVQKKCQPVQGGKKGCYVT